MSSRSWLVAAILGLFGLSCYLIATRPEITLEGLEDLEEDWWG